jgi:hypothetical protein
MTKQVADKGTITFDAKTWVRIRRVQRTLRCSYVEIVQMAVRHSLDEWEADIRAGRM